jgi:hypothetical protein
MELKIYEIQWIDGGKEWVSEYTKFAALSRYLIATGLDIFDIADIADIVEVQKEHWQKYKVFNNDKEDDESDEITFEEWMRENQSPGIICGDMF